MKKILIIVIIILGAAAIFFLTRKSEEPAALDAKPDDGSAPTITFDNPKKSAHYESNTPEHGAILPGVPINVAIDFNFDLHETSSISIALNGKEYGIGETAIDNNKLTMRRAMDPASPDGIYRVAYNACWPDRSCHEGYFQFAIAREGAEAALDMTGKSKVTIELNEIAFAPRVVKISKGTTVAWKNLEAIGHYVNTDSHPAHTYYPEQNSPLLNQGGIFELTFEIPGVYPYHCSAHAEAMKGMIIVEE